MIVSILFIILGLGSVESDKINPAYLVHVMQCRVGDIRIKKGRNEI